MAQKVIDPQDLYRNVVHALQRGLRTSTYKLATMTALVDFSVVNKPDIASSVLEVPLAQLARRVMALYWDQLRPFEGAPLRQSTQPRSRIFDAIESLRSAANCPDDDRTLETAAKLAPGVFRRVTDELAVCLAQQPLPRLQRTLGSAPSLRFLFDDGFLHDDVTRAELARHRYAIQLNPGVAQGLASQAERLNQLIKNIWVDDVLRINKMGSDQRAKLKEHLFGNALSPFPPARMAATSVDTPPDVRSTTQPDENVAGLLFATRLNRLIAAMPDYSSGEVAAQIRQSGFPMTVTTLTQLQAGVGPAPSIQAITALAKHFGVDPTYFFGETTSTEAGTQSPKQTDPASFASRVSAPLEPKPSDVETNSIRSRAERPGRLVLQADIGTIRNLCSIDESGCWIPSSAGPMACRADGDERADDDLPLMAPHRWVWMVAHGRASDPLPGSFHVRRRCGNPTCCRPEHLYLTTTQGRELTLEVAESLLNLQRRQWPTGLETGGRHRKLEDRDPPRIANAADGMANFAARLNQLFEESTLPDGVSRTSRGVAAALQEEGLPVSESLIDRLRSGQGDAPSIQTIEALAYLFNVDAGYFSERVNLSMDDHAFATDAPSTSSTSSTTPPTTYDDQTVAISVDELGQVVTGLSEAISHCLASEPTRTQTATRLARVLADVGAVLSEGDLIIDRTSLRRIVDEWNRLAQGSKHREIRARLSHLANGEYLR